jgi:putative ABC transport system substrate-binding protein
MRNSKGIIAACLLLVPLLACAVRAAEPAPTPLVLVLSSQDSNPYKLTRAAFEEHLSTYFPDAEYRHYLVGLDHGQNSLPVFSAETEEAPSIILALGTRAIEQAQLSFPDIALVTSMVLKDNVTRPPEQYRAILLQIPAAVQLQWLVKFLPAVRKVGILYDPDRSSDLISAFQEASAGTGIDIVPVKISSVAQLKEGLQYISKQADVLLAVPDATVYSGKTAKEVLLFSYRNSIPFIGLSSTWVEAGALYALEVNYIDIGKQCAESARQMLAGAPPAKQPKLSADKVTYTVNSKTIQQLRLNIDPELISGGLEIFE